MSPLESGESFATGMVRPKTTALFFDKLWVHPALIKGFIDNDLEPYRVPPEFCVLNPVGAGDYYDSWERQELFVKTQLEGVDSTERIEVKEALRRLSEETWDVRSIFAVEAMEHFGVGPEVVYSELADPIWERMRERLPPPPPEDLQDDNWKLYLTTIQRNKAIAFIVQMYAKRGINLTPIFLTPSEFEEVIAPESAGLEVCIKSIRTVDESQLTWEQVFGVRNDKKSKQKLDRLRRWFTIDLAKKSEDEIKARLDQKIDDYEYALRKHGIETILGGVTSVFATGSGALALLETSPLAAVFGGLALGSGVAVWIVKRLVDRSELKRNEVAYIYDVRKLAE